MTYKQLQDEVLTLRFDESKRASVKSWLNIGYQRIWNLRDWTFKHASAILTVTGNDNSPAMPLDFARALALYDDFGHELPYLERLEWEQDYLYATGGRVQAWTVIDRQIYLGPKQVSAITLSLSYKRRMAIVSAASGVIGGNFQADTDQPIWPAEHDYALIFEAAVIGETMLDGLSSADLTTRRDEALTAMTHDLAGSQTPGIRFWGASGATSWRQIPGSWDG